MNKFTIIFVVMSLFISVTFLSACNDKYTNVTGKVEIISEKSFQISPGKNLILDAPGADVSISSWDKSEVYFKVTGSVKAREKLDIDYSADDSNVILKIKPKKSFLNWLNNISLSVEVKLPKNFNTDVSTSGGDITLNNVDGNLLLETSGGDIDCNSFTGNLEVSTSGGDITLSGKDSKIDASTSGGDIMLDYSGKNNGISLSTSGGDILVKLPADFSAAMNISTSGGDVMCNLKMNNVEKLDEQEVIADLNEGGDLFSASTSGGDIDVRKK